MKSLDEKFLIDDGIFLTNNLYFGIGSSYYCGHGCKVCFIRDELRELKSKTPLIYNNDLKKMEKTWDELFTFFTTTAADEDPYFFKINHPKEYQWYVENAHKCSYGTTDNGIFRIRRIINELDFQSMAEISLSTSWCEHVGHEKIIEALEDLMPIEKMKFIVDTKYYPKEIVDWARSHDMPMVVHKLEFTRSEVTEFELVGFETVQENDWVSGKQGLELVKIHMESDVILYYDSFYFSNNIGDRPYFKLSPDGFDYRKFLSSMLEGKIRDYKIYSELIEGEMKDYFLNTLRYKVNHDYNFIPNYMIDWNVRYFHRMRELGWKATKYGLIYPSDKVIPIIEVK
jgi:hypothetical protein